MLNILFSVVSSRQGGAGKSRKRARSEQTTPFIRCCRRRRASNPRRHPGRRRPSSDTNTNDVVDGDSGFQRTDIECANSSKMALDYIPEWLVLNILVRLPSKFVVRCKLVCKQWASLISDPSFVRSYLSHSSLLSPSRTVIEERMRHISPRKIRLLEYNIRRDIYSNPRQYTGELDLPTAHELIEHESCFKVFGASNGLILFGLECYDTSTCSLFYACDPVTRKLVSLSPLPQKYLALKRRAGPGFVALLEDAVLESFRAVLLLLDAKTGRPMFVAYASETREWTEFLFPGDESNQDILEKNPTALNGILHWETRDGSLIAYDPYEEPSRTRVIAPPKDADAREGVDELELSRRCLIDASVGKLRYFEKSIVAANGGGFAVRLRVWVLEEYGSGGAWCLWHESDDTSVLVSDYRLPRPVLTSLTPMFFDPFDSDVVYMVLLGSLLSYDFWSGKFEVVRVSEESGAFVLELSPWPISITPPLS